MVSLACRKNSESLSQVLPPSLSQLLPPVNTAKRLMVPPPEPDLLFGSHKSQSHAVSSPVSSAVLYLPGQGLVDQIAMTSRNARMVLSRRTLGQQLMQLNSESLSVKSLQRDWGSLALRCPL